MLEIEPRTEQRTRPALCTGHILVGETDEDKEGGGGELGGTVVAREGAHRDSDIEAGT